MKDCSCVLVQSSGNLDLSLASRNNLKTKRTEDRIHLIIQQKVPAFDEFAEEFPHTDITVGNPERGDAIPLVLANGSEFGVIYLLPELADWYFDVDAASCLSRHELSADRM